MNRQKFMRMNRISGLSVIAFVCLATYASAQAGWPQITSPRGGFVFKMPSQPQYHFDGAHTSLYHLQVDSTLIMEIHYTDSARIDYNMGDPYTLFAQSMVYTTNGELESIEDIVANSGRQGKEIGISYFTEEGVHQFLFTRLFFWDDRFLSFTIVANEASLLNLLSIKTIYFNSIAIFDEE